MNHKIVWIRWAVILLFVVLSGVCYSCSPEQAVMLNVESTEDEPVVETEALSEPSSQAETEPAWYYVHICGEVRQPGVYQMEEGQRIYQLVELAGGYTDAAATDFLNMAEPVSDGMKVIVPDRESLLAENSGLYGEAETKGAESSGNQGKVNINTAGQEELMTLPGIGQARAADIMAYRENQGGFQAIEDIMKVSGIKQTAFEKIKERITVG